MKKKFMSKVLNLTAFIVITSITAISTIAQTNTRPVYIVNDTTGQAKSALSFDVQIITDEENQKFILAINNPFSEKLRINISGPEGVGFMDYTKALHYRKRVNMQEAQDGNYTVTVTGEQKTFSKNINLNTATVQKRSLLIE